MKPTMNVKEHWNRRVATSAKFVIRGKRLGHDANGKGKHYIWEPVSKKALHKTGELTDTTPDSGMWGTITLTRRFDRQESLRICCDRNNENRHVLRGCMRPVTLLL